MTREPHETETLYRSACVVQVAVLTRGGEVRAVRAGPGVRALAFPWGMLAVSGARGSAGWLDARAMEGSVSE